MQAAEMDRRGTGLVFCVTGANKGLGLEACKQLARADGVAKVILTCRSRSKADAAIFEINQCGGRAALAFVELDTGSLDSCRAAVPLLKEACGGKLDGLLMNAGGTPGADAPPKARNETSKCSNIVTINVLGHAVLLQGLVAAGCPPARAVFSGSEGGRDCRFAQATAECVAAEMQEAKGSGAMAKEYGSAKAIGALYMSAFARRNPSVRAFTVSPGGTHGTGAFDTAPACLPCLCNTVCMPCRMCICHALPLGAARYVDALMDAEYPYASGTFVGCRSGMKGPVADQATIKGGAIYADQPMQEAAYEAVQRFI